MDRSEQRRIVEALVMGSPEPITPARLAEVVPGCTAGDAKDLVNELNTEYQEQDRSFEIWEVAGGYQLRSRFCLPSACGTPSQRAVSKAGAACWHGGCPR